MSQKVPISNLATNNPAKNIYNSSELSALAPRPYMNRRKAELRIMKLISMGDVSLLEDRLQQTAQMEERIDLGRLSQDNLTHSKYMGVIMASMACRAAIDGGVPEHIAFNLSDAFIREIDTMKYPSQLNGLIYNVIIENCRAVHKHRLMHLSPPVKQCCEYFFVKMHNTVTLEELGRVCHLSPNYISDLFRKELGMGAIQYFQKEKLNMAKYFLEHTDVSISDIAATLAYPSHSHFAQRFKKHYGCTPSEYRERACK